MKKILSHHLGRSVMLTPPQLRENLSLDLELGFGGCAVVYDLMQGDTAEFIRVFQEMKAKTLVVGFNPGDGPSPFRDESWGFAAKKIRNTAELVANLVDYGLSEPIMVGPIHTHHRTSFDSPCRREKIDRWHNALNCIGEEYEIIMACEPLNPIEQPCEEDPFEELFKACVQYPNLKIHWDSGHAHARGKSWVDAKDALPYISFFELANVGRFPIRVDKGIDFTGYFELIKEHPVLPFILGVEPFCSAVIEAFDLKGLCDTSYDGPQALALDAEALKAAGLM